MAGEALLDKKQTQDANSSKHNKRALIGPAPYQIVSQPWLNKQANKERNIQANKQTRDGPAKKDARSPKHSKQALVGPRPFKWDASGPPSNQNCLLPLSGPLSGLSSFIP